MGIIRDDHIEAIKSYIRSSEIAKAALGAVLQECQDLVTFLNAAQRIGEISPRSIDRIISRGELLSAIFLAALLQDRGIDSQLVDLSDVVNLAEHSRLDQDFYTLLAASLGSKVRACGEKVPVITGFFGVVPGGLLCQVGRGYTDLCAALAAIGLGARELQVWKEVDGIFTASVYFPMYVNFNADCTHRDPRKVPTAKLLLTITPAEAAELTFYGSEVIHPFTMEQAIHARIPIRIKNVMNPRGSGTIILPETPESSASALPSPSLTLFRRRGASLSLEDQRPKRPTAITIKHNILVINIHSNKRSISYNFFTNIFSTLDKWRLSVDLISTSEVHVSMALHFDSPLVTGGGDDDEKEIVHVQLRGALAELKQYGTVDLMDNMAIVSLVGRQMKHMVGIAGKMFLTLGENNVNIEMISQGRLSNRFIAEGLLMYKIYVRCK